MLRRNTRLRKEYLYRRSLQGQQQAEYEKKVAVRDAIREGRPLPADLRDDAVALQEEAEFESNKLDEVEEAMEVEGKVAGTKVGRRGTSLASADAALISDSEYARAGFSDPKILITTARNPSAKLMQFTKELKFVFPNTTRINRGNHVLDQLVAACRQHNATDLILVHETRGVPDGLIVSHMPYGPTAYFALLNVVPRHDIDNLGHMSLQNPHLIFHGFTTRLGERVANVLKYLFPPAKEDSARVVTFANSNDFISFRQHTYTKAGHKEVVLTEVGPRFELQLYQIKLGTLEMTEAENEWVLRPYMNSSKKRQALGGSLPDTDVEATPNLNPSDHPLYA